MRIVPALDRGLTILVKLSRTNDSLSTAQLAQMTNIPKSAMYEILNTLQKHNFIQSVGGAYKLGPAVATLGNHYLQQINFIEEAVQATRDLTRATEETSQVGVLDGHEVVYIAKSDSSHQIRLISSVGGRLPASCTALGKSMLAGLADEEVETLYRGSPPEKLTSKSLDFKQLLAELRRTRERGYAIDHGESTDNVSCFAVSIATGPNEPPAALSVSVLSVSLTQTRETELIKALMECAAEFASRVAVSDWSFLAQGSSFPGIK